MSKTQIPCTLDSGDSVFFDIDDTEDDDAEIVTTWYDVYSAAAGK